MLNKPFEFKRKKTVVMKTRDLYHSRPINSMMWLIRTNSLSEIRSKMSKKRTR